MIHAIVHTNGVVLYKTYVPLELAYRDALGVEAHFLIASPIPFSKMRRLYPHSRPDVRVVTGNEGVPYSQVLDFLKLRRRVLSDAFSRAVFGFKGSSYQSRVLRDAGITDVVNLEELGVPALRHSGTCRWHTGSQRKCALASLRQILRHVVP